MNTRVMSSPFRTIFMCADSIDILLMVLGLFGSMGDGLTTPVLILLMRQAMNNFGAGPANDPHAFHRAVTRNALLFLYSACGSFIACFLEGYCWTRTGERQASRMRHKYLKAVLRQDVTYFDLKTTSTSEVVNSVSNDTLAIQDVIGEKVPNFLMHVFLAIGCYITALLVMWRYAIMALPFVLLLIIPGLVYGRVLMGLNRKVRDEDNKAGLIVEQAVSSIRTVYSFVAETKTVNEFSAALEGSVTLGLKKGLAKGVAIGSNGITYVVWAFMAWYSSRLLMHLNGKGGTVFAVGTAICRGGLSIGAAISSVKDLSEACAAGERMMEVMKRVPKTDADNMEGEILAIVSGEVEFKNLEFAYPSRPDSIVLHEFSMKVPARKTVALVGGSGSGKSTIIALLQRFYDPNGGQILLDGVPIITLQLKWFRSRMGLVSQEPSLFATSIRENIIFGKEDATFEEVIAAAKASNAHDFITQLPQGYDTQVGERGVQMSGGQKQRIAIARAIIREPQILLLDEATSALDSESESIVQEALNSASLGRTTIVIAHRLSTIRSADRIIVLQNGQVIETGSNDELIQDDKSLYSSFVRLQHIGQTTDEKKSTMFPCSPSHVTSIDHNQSRRRLNEDGGSSLKNSVSVRSVTSVEGNNKKDIPAPTCRRLLLLNIPEWKQACMGCTSAALSGAVHPIHSLILGGMISVYFLTDHGKIQSMITTYSLSFLGLAFFSLVISISQHYNFAAMGEYLTKRIREQMLSKVLTFEVGWYDQNENSSGAICSRLTRDASGVRSLVGDQMSLLVQTMSAVTLSATLGLIIAWRLAVVIIAVQPLILMCFYFRNALLKIMSCKAIASQDESSKLASEAVSNLRTVTSFSSQKRILEMLDQTQIGLHQENVRQSLYAGLGLGISRGLASCTWALHFWYGGELISHNYITAKEFYSTFLVLVNTGRVIADAASSTTDLSKGTDAVESVFAVLDRDTRVDSENPEGYKPEKINGHIELLDVHFVYPARPNVIIFERFSLSIEAGVSTALVGQSGSGKSTIISLIERFYDPLKGMVSIDGRDVKSYHLRSLRKQIALVSQEPTLFSGTIRENIEYGVSNKADEAEVVNAARAANAHNFIAGLRDGYDTWCGDRGLQLSGGQKQRIAIARAMLKNPTILLLDEATSALDSQSEKEVQEALDRMMVGRTSVVVAHRLNTIRNCNTIAVLDRGEVVEKGSHSSLLRKGPDGAYRTLVSIQQQKPSTHQTVS